VLKKLEMAVSCSQSPGDRELEMACKLSVAHTRQRIQVVPPVKSSCVKILTAIKVEKAFISRDGNVSERILSEIFSGEKSSLVTEKVLATALKIFSWSSSY